MNTSVKPVSATRVITGPKCRFSYCHIWEPQSINDGDPRYSLCVLIPKTDKETVQKIRAAMEAAYKEGVVDFQAQPILDRSEVYSGCYGRVSLTFFVFNTNGNRGIAVGLNNVMKCYDGEPLGGHMSAEAEFAGLEVPADDEEDFLN